MQKYMPLVPLGSLAVLGRPYILREKSLAIYFGDSQFRRNMTFNFIVSKYMLTNVREYDDINRLKFHIM